MIKILISDATPHNRQNLAAYLMQSSQNVVGTAASGQETLKLAKTLTPELIILDTNLPDGDVFTLIRQLKNMSQPPAIILLMVSSDPAIEQQGSAAGADACLAKNEGIDPLIETIQKIQKTQF